MTNSHNRSISKGGKSEGNSSRQQLVNGSNVSQQQSFFGKHRKSNYKGKKQQNKKSTSPTDSISSSQSDSTSNFNNVRSNHQNYQRSSNNHYHKHHNQQYKNNYHGINIQLHRSSPGGLSGSSASSLPSNNNNGKFASSKCFDAPSPTVLPRPPSRWLFCGAALSQQADDNLSHKLKLMLNVKNVEKDLLMSSPICITSPANQPTAVAF